MLFGVILSAVMGGQAGQLRTDVISIDPGVESPISPYIYGVNYPDSWIGEWLKEWDSYGRTFALAREGGNRFTAYNWETNASNAGADYFFENDDYLAPTDEPGWSVRQFLTHVQASGAAALLTVPTIGFVAADKDTKRDGGKDVNHTKDWLHQRFLPSVASKQGGHFVYPPDRNDRVVYQDEFVHWVTRIKSNRTPVWFSLDNEPDFWYNTHARIHPSQPSYAELIGNNIEYATAIKRVAPRSLVFGPVNYGWYGLRALQGAKDANGRVFMDAYLDAFRSASSKVGHRLLDVYDFHWYPEATGDGIRIIYNSAPDKPGTEEARIQAPRSLWDPTYIESSWIPKSMDGQPIRLLPRLSETVQAHYPGTKLGITEYEFGGRNTISGALAQADALGVFGRYGLFAACHWGVNQKEKPVMAAFMAYTNYDRKGSTFGDRGLTVKGEVPSQNSVYAAIDSKDRKRMTVLVVNKEKLFRNTTLSMGRFKAKTARAFTIDGAHFENPEVSNPDVKDGLITVKIPPRSVTTIEIRG